VFRIRSSIYITTLLAIAASLAGCNELGLRKGPAPILDVASVQTAATNQTTVLYALAQDAGYPHPELGGIDWYRVAEAGFNYVDDQCSAYFDTIFFLDRERSQLKSGLAAASATTAAILGVTSASTLSLSVVASAFGFASAATDILAGTYLYSLPPATTQGLVNKLQAAYRDAAANVKSEISTPTAAYHHIQSYLALCLPPTIETEVVKTVNAAGAQVVVGPSRTTFSVGSVAAPTPTAPKGRFVTGQNPPPPPPPPPPPEVRVVSACDPGVCQGRFEVGLTKKRTIELQSIAGISPPDGKFTSATKEAILSFLRSHNMKDSRSPDAITSTDDVCMKRFRDGTIGAECIVPPNTP
jgi:hypothetical protein